MNDDQIAYLTEIGLSAVAIERAREVTTQATRAFPGELEEIFVTDFLDGEGRRTYGSLWLVTDNYITEAKSFMSQTNFDYVARDLTPYYADINSSNFDFETFDDASRLTITLSFKSRLQMIFPATRNNCPRLMNFVRTLFLRPDGLAA